jgi:hypothetical protein
VTQLRPHDRLGFVSNSHRMVNTHTAKVSRKLGRNRALFIMDWAARTSIVRPPCGLQKRLRSSESSFLPVVPKGPLAADAPPASEFKKAMSFEEPLVLSLLSLDSENTLDSDRSHGASRLELRSFTARYSVVRPYRTCTPLVSGSGLIAVRDRRRKHSLAGVSSARVPVWYDENPERFLSVSFHPLAAVCEQVAVWPQRELLACGDVESNPGPMFISDAKRRAHEDFHVSRNDNLPRLHASCPLCVKLFRSHNEHMPNKSHFNYHCPVVDCVVCRVRLYMRICAGLPPEPQGPNDYSHERLDKYIGISVPEMDSMISAALDTIAEEPTDDWRVTDTLKIFACTLVGWREFPQYIVMREAIVHRTDFAKAEARWDETHVRNGEAEAAYAAAGTPPHPGPPKTNRVFSSGTPLLRIGVHFAGDLETRVVEMSKPTPPYDFDAWFKDNDYDDRTYPEIATQYDDSSSVVSMPASEVLEFPTTVHPDVWKRMPLHKSFAPTVQQLQATAAREKRKEMDSMFKYMCSLWDLCLAIARVDKCARELAASRTPGQTGWPAKTVVCSFHTVEQAPRKLFAPPVHTYRVGEALRPGPYDCETIPTRIPTALFAPPVFTYRVGEASTPGPDPHLFLESWVNIALARYANFLSTFGFYVTVLYETGSEIANWMNEEETLGRPYPEVHAEMVDYHRAEQRRQRNRWVAIDVIRCRRKDFDRLHATVSNYINRRLPTPSEPSDTNQDDRGGLHTTGVNFRHPGPRRPASWADDEVSQTSSESRRTPRSNNARVVCVEGFFKDPINGRCGNPDCIRDHFGEETFDELDRRLILQNNLCLNTAAYGTGHCRRAECQRVHELPHKYRRVDSPAVNALIEAVSESNATVRRHVAPAAKPASKRNRNERKAPPVQPPVSGPETTPTAPPDGNFYLPRNCVLPRHEFTTGPPPGTLSYVLHLPWEAAAGYSGSGGSLLAVVDDLIELHTPTYSLVIPRAEVYLVPLLGSTLLGRGQPVYEIGPSAHTAADVPLRPTNIIVDAADVLTRTPHTNILHLPAHAVGSVLMAYNRSGNVLAQPTLERLVDNLVKEQKWLARVAAVNPLDCALIPASIREYVMALNTTIGMAEVPTWLNTEDGRIKRMLRSLFRRRNFVPTVKDRFRIAHSRDSGRAGPHYPQMVESERGDNPSVTVGYSHSSYAADEVAMCGGPYTDYLHCGFSLSGVGTSYSNARIAMVPVFDLRLTRHVEPSNPTAQHAEAWRRAQNVYDALIGTPTRVMVDADPLLHLSDDVPITGRVPVVMADDRTRHLSPIFAAWYWHLDSSHRRVYTIVLNDIEREQGCLDAHDEFDNVINKVFVKIEIAPRLLMKAVRPRVITYMEHSRAVKISHEAWHCIEYLKMVMHQTDFPVVDASGLNTSDLEWRLRRFLSARHEESPYLMDNFQMWLMGDDNIIFLKDALDPAHFYSVAQHYGRQPEVFRAYNVYQLSFCSRDFFRAYDSETKEYFPRLMLKPFKQISKLPYLKIRGGAVTTMLRDGAKNRKVREAAKAALANKAVSMFVEYGCDPFMSQLAIDLLKLTDSPIPERYDAVKYQLDRHEPERRYRLTRQQLLSRNPETDEGFYQTYEIRYGITRGALDMLRDTIVGGFRTYFDGGDEMPEIDLSDYPRTLDLDIGPGLNDAEYPFPEGDCGGVEIDYAAFDTTTNEDTHNNNFARQRHAFGERKFTNVLDKVRRNARLEGDNPQQRISARVKYQMLSGHADTSAGNGISNATENIASLIYSYPHALVDLERIYQQQALRPKLDMREHPTNLTMEYLLPGQAAAEVTDQRSRTRTQRSPGMRAIFGRR